MVDRILKCLWRGVVSAGITGITAQQPFNAKPTALYQAVFHKDIAGVMRTTGSKSARWRAKRTNQVLIGADQFDYNFAHRFFTLLNNTSKLSPRVPLSWAQARLTITTTSSLQVLTSCWRNASRMTLLTKFRCTALGNIFFLAIIPSLAFA